jgi:penicillin-binding protein-related factor A (putative recombinase)
MASSFPGHHAYGFLFVWGYVKDRVYAKEVNDVIELRHRIEQAVASMMLDMIHSTWSEISYRLDILRATRGAHVEVY